MKKFAAFLGLVAIAGVMLGWSPNDPYEPLPETVSEAQSYVSNMVYYWTQQSPSSVTCLSTTIVIDGEDYFECTATKSGYDDQLVIVKKK